MKIKKTYRFFTAGNKVVAVSTYAGKTVRGTAKCSPEDNFSLEDGQALAAARCNLKISEKRRNRAMRKLEEAKRTMADAQQNFEKMLHYFEDASNALADAHAEVNELMDELLVP